DRRQYGRTRTQFVELAEHAAVAADVEADFLEGLTQRGVFQRLIARIEATAGQSDLTAPGIAVAQRAAHQEQFEIVGVAGLTQHERDGRFLEGLVTLGERGCSCRKGALQPRELRRELRAV